MKQVLHESTPFTKEDCLLVFVRQNKTFDFPIHFHTEYELNFILNSKGATRIVGDHKSMIDDCELVLIGPNVIHSWESNLELHNSFEITIQFQRDLFPISILEKKVFHDIKNLINNASRGISFSKESILEVIPLLYEIASHKSIEVYMKLLEILNILSKDKNFEILNKKQQLYIDIQNNQINKIYNYIEQNFKNKISLEEIAKHLNMTVISFSRLIKEKTGKTFVTFVNDYRINYASRILLETPKSIADITEECGFNNQANFNRIFKSKMKQSPSDYRKQTTEKLTVH